MQNTPSLPLLPGLLWPGVVVPDRVLSIDQIELNCVLMLNWIAWNRTVLTFKLRFDILNWIAWNRTVFDIETVLTLNWNVWNRTVYIHKNGFDIK